MIHLFILLFTVFTISLQTQTGPFDWFQPKEWFYDKPKELFYDKPKATIEDAAAKFRRVIEDFQKQLNSLSESIRKIKADIDEKRAVAEQTINTAKENIRTARALIDQAKAAGVNPSEVAQKVRDLDIKESDLKAQLARIGKSF